MLTKIDLLISSLNPDEELLNRVLVSATGFDNILLHIDSDTVKKPQIVDLPNIVNFNSNKHYTFPDAITGMIYQSDADWLLIWADNEPFIDRNLSEVLNLMKSYPPDCDILVTGEAQNLVDTNPHYRLDMTIHDLNFSIEQICENNTIISPYFVKTSILKSIDGFIGDIANDWILNIRLKRKGYKFKKINVPIYYYEPSKKGGLWDRTFASFGYDMGKVRQEVNRVGLL